MRATPTLLLAPLVLLVACKDPPPPDPVAPTATPAASKPPEPAPPATTYEICPPGWNSNEIRRVRKYVHVALADLPASLPRDGHFDTEGTVTARSTCPPCPPGAMCKPCPDAYTDVQEGMSAPLRVLTPSGVDFTVGQRYKLSIAACAGHTPLMFQLRGYEPDR